MICAGRSVSSAALLGVMKERNTNPDAEETSKTVQVNVQNFKHTSGLAIKAGKWYDSKENA